MSAQTLNEELALRIGMAARVLPDTDPRRLMRVLVDAIGLPINEARLEGLTIEKLRKAAHGELAAVPLPPMKEAIDYLWGRESVSLEDAHPSIEPYTEGEMPGSIRLAIASNSETRLDGHFGSCNRFYIWQVGPEERRLIDVRSAASGDNGDERNANRALQIADCHLLYVLSIGGPAAAKVVRNDIHPIKFQQGGEVSELLDSLQRVLSEAPPPWLARVMGLENRTLVEDEAEA